MKMKVEVNPGSVNGTPEKMRCGRVLRLKNIYYGTTSFQSRVKEHSLGLRDIIYAMHHT